MVLATDPQIRCFIACIDEKKKTGRCTCIKSTIDPKPLPKVKKVNNQVVQYQIGVDVLGFPMYMEHQIYQDQLPEHPHNKKKHWITIIQKIIKQQ